VSQTERRCPSCGALVAPDAEWCGQCLRPLEPTPASEPAPVRAAVGPVGEREGRPTWACPTCEHENPIALDGCEVCGTPFARLFAAPEPRVEIDPASALRWSLLLPGLGHWKAGHRLDGVARIVLFVWTFGTVVVLLATRSGGIGTAGALLALYAVSAIALYVVSAVDARRIASDQDPIVSSRAMLWASVVLVVLSVLVATVLSLPALRGG
jgi:Double zinc ribbon